MLRKTIIPAGRIFIVNKERLPPSNIVPCITRACNIPSVILCLIFRESDAYSNEVHRASCFPLLLQHRRNDCCFTFSKGETLVFSRGNPGVVKRQDRGIVLLLNEAHPRCDSLSRIAACEIKNARSAGIFAVPLAAKAAAAAASLVSEETGERHSSSSTYAKSWCRKLALIQVAVAS